MSRPTPSPPAFDAVRSISSEAERRPLSQYMRVDEIGDDGGWTIFDSGDASNVAKPRLDLSVLKRIKNFLSEEDESACDGAFFGDETLVDSNEPRVDYPFYDATPSLAEIAEITEITEDDEVDEADEDDEADEADKDDEVDEADEADKDDEVDEDDEDDETTKVVETAETGPFVVDFTETLADFAPRTAVALAPKPTQPRSRRRSKRLQPLALNAESVEKTSTPQTPLVDNALPRSAEVENDVWQSTETTIAPAPSAYISESTEILQLAENVSSAQTVVAVACSFETSASEAPSSPAAASRPSVDFDENVRSTRSSERRLPIFQRFVKLVARNARPDVAPNLASNDGETPEKTSSADFGANVAFVAAAFAPPTESAPFFADASNAAPFSHF
ncbi:MAG: hypothetical protein IKU86_00100 [Thermoguttaceae bacterium]|nr:hypothetical protein [Thermoguttaceae bacterium]